MASAVGAGEVVRPFRTKKDRKTEEKADILGVCLVGKRDSSTTVVPVCSGCLVKGLFFSEKLFIITSDQIRERELIDCIVYFPAWNSDTSSKLKEYKLTEIWTSQDSVQVNKRLKIIPIDEKKLGKGSFLSFVRRWGRSGMLTYRPRQVKGCVTKTLPKSICQIVDGNTNGFALKKYDVEYMDGEYVLKPRGKEEDVFKTFRDLTGGGSNSLHPRGAVILTPESPFEAIGVLMFDEDGKIQPVMLSELQVSGTCGTNTRQREVQAEASAVYSESRKDKIPTEGTSGPNASPEEMHAEASAVYSENGKDKIPTEDSSGANASLGGVYVEASAAYIENRKDNIPTEGTSGANASPEEMQAETSTVYSERRKDKILNEDQCGARETAAGEKSSPVVTGRHPCKDTNATKNLDSKVPVGKSSPSQYNVSHHKQGRGHDRGANETGDSDNIPPSAGDYDVSLLNKDTKNLPQAAPQHQSPPTTTPATAAAHHEPTGENNNATAGGKYEVHMENFHGEMVVGDHNKMNVPVVSDSSTDAAPQHQSPSTMAPETVAPPGPTGATQNQNPPSSTSAAAAGTTEPTAVPPPTNARAKYVIHYKGYTGGKLMVGDHNTLNVGS